VFACPAARGAGQFRITVASKLSLVDASNYASLPAEYAQIIPATSLIAPRPVPGDAFIPIIKIGPCGKARQGDSLIHLPSHLAFSPGKTEITFSAGCSFLSHLPGAATPTPVGFCHTHFHPSARTSPPFLLTLRQPITRTARLRMIQTQYSQGRWRERLLPFMV